MPARWKPLQGNSGELREGGRALTASSTFTVPLRASPTCEMGRGPAALPSRPLRASETICGERDNLRHHWYQQEEPPPSVGATLMQYPLPPEAAHEREVWEECDSRFLVSKVRLESTNPHPRSPCQTPRLFKWLPEGEWPRDAFPGLRFSE